MTVNACFEQGPIRPPSEARSLLIRPTRNCPWNKCAFCHTYKGSRFELRPVEEIKQDIDAVRALADAVGELSWKLGQGGRVNDAVVSWVFGNEGSFSDPFRHVAAWLYFGGRTAFLQDADTLIMKTDDLVEVLRYLREKFPGIERITSYCRSRTAAHKSVEDLRRIREAGLVRIHVGLESGCDEVLRFIRKGATAEEHVKGGKRIVEAGISLCEYVMPGLGGSRWSREHAVETARVLSEINPDHIRLRTLSVRRGTPLYDAMREGGFAPLGDEEILKEIRLFIESLDGIQSRIVSDHILNLLEELEGKLPEEKEKLLGIIDRYLQLSETDRLVFRLGRRRGIYRTLDDLSEPGTYRQLRQAVERYQQEEPGRLDRDLDRIRESFI
ncbi:MAG TPA: radical SAM protein [Syntrophales bacterium]|nr:radical SAM protein [Syntrophobacterales bacterium]HQL89060.1 radical SAM protein [Syntrophales bacterium]